MQEYNPNVTYALLKNSIKYVGTYDGEITVSNALSYTADFPQADTEEIIREGNPAGKVTADTSAYRLKLNGSVISTPQFIEKQGNDLKNKYLQVAVTEVGGQFGASTGAGTYSPGDYAWLQAYELWDGRFIGWYSDAACQSGQLVSDSASFVLPITNTMIDNNATDHTYNIFPKFEFAASAGTATARNSSIDSETSTGTQITVTWQKPSNDPEDLKDIHGYLVKRWKKPDAGSEYNVLSGTYTVTGGSTTSYVDNTSQLGTSYKYEIIPLSEAHMPGESFTESAVHSYTEPVTAALYWCYIDNSTNDVTSGYTIDRTKAPKGNDVEEHKQNDPANSVFTIPAGHEYLRSMDIKIVDNSGNEVTDPNAYIPPVKVIIHLGIKYNGRQVTVQHYMNNPPSGAENPEWFRNLTVVDGKVTVEVENFSPFFVTLSKLPAPQPTPTPDNGNTYTYSGSSQTTDDPVPYAPQYVQAQNYGIDLTGKPQVMLLWQRPAMDAAGLRQIAGYSVYRDDVWIGTVNGVNTLYYIDNSVENGKTYRYTVKALGVECGTESVASNEAVITVDALNVGTANPTFTASRAAGEATDGSQSGFNRADAAQTGKNQSGEVAAKINQAEAVQEDNPVTTTNPAQKAQNATDSTRTEAADSQQAMKMNQTGILAGGIAKVAVPAGIGVLLLCGMLILILLKRRNHDDMES